VGSGFKSRGVYQGKRLRQEGKAPNCGNKESDQGRIAQAVRMGPRMIRIRREDLDAILQPYDAGQAGQWAHLR
jgi:hypothetical protein